MGLRQLQRQERTRRAQGVLLRYRQMSFERPIHTMNWVVHFRETGDGKVPDES